MGLTGRTVLSAYSSTASPRPRSSEVAEGLLKPAFVPTPSTAPAAPPATAATAYVSASGSVLRFHAAHAAAHVHGTTAACAGKSGQKKPGGQAAGTVDGGATSAAAPAAQPGLSTQGAGSATPPAHQKPAGQSAPGGALPTPQNDPGAAPQGTHTDALAALHVPAGHWKNVALEHAKPAAQATHVSARTRRLTESVTSKSPHGVMTTLLIVSKRASAPGALTKPATPRGEPAIGATSPVSVETSRARWPNTSVTMSAPEACSARPVGCEKAAHVLTPSA